MKGFKKVFNKTVTMLTLMAMLVSCVGLVSVSAEVAEGCKIDTIDDLWNYFGKQKTVLTLDNMDINGNYVKNYIPNDGSTNDHDYMTIDYENGTDGNVVLKSGNGTTDNRGIMSYTGMSSKLGETRKQKWEVEVKLSHANDVVHALAYAGNQWAILSYYHDSQATPVKFESGAVKLYDVQTATWTDLYTGTVADQWYKVVRYMDFSVNGENMQRVLLYSVENNGTSNETKTLLADSGEIWLQAGTQTYRPANQTLLAVGFDVTTATEGPVMFDDFGVYDMPVAPTMAVDANYVNGGNKIKTIDDVWKVAGNQKKTFTVNDESLRDATGYLPNATGVTHQYMTIDYESGSSGNVVFKSGNGTDNKGVFSYTGMTAYMGATRNQMWEIKVKLASTTDAIDLLPYGTDWAIYPYKYNSDNHAGAGSPIQITNGVVKVKNDTSWIELYNGLQANQWYKFVRYMDFNEDGNNKQRVKIYQVNNNGTANESLVPLADSGAAFLKSGAQKWRAGGNTLLSIGANVTKADVAPVMFDDLFAYEVESFAFDTSAMAVDSASVKIGFNSPMNAESFDASAVTLEANGKEVELKNVSYDSDANSIIVEFNTLQYSTTYELNIDSSVMKSDDELPIEPAPLVWSFTTEEDPLSIGACFFRNDADEDISSLTAIPAGTKVKGSATLINESATEREYVVILAIYEGDKLVNIAATPGKIANTEATGTEISTPVLTVANASSSAELFVWDSWNRLRPLAEKSVLPAQ